METLYYSRFNSPVGPLVIAVSDRGLVLLEFDHDQLMRKRWPKFSWEESQEKTRPYVQQLDEYFAGRRRKFDFPLDLRGTDFQKRCWRELLKVPYGKTASYAEIARAVGSPRAFRAVGMANHSNPIAIVIPCHRVIGANGSLTGFGGGLEIKRKLLVLEGALSQSPAGTR
jgi:O-6-methylguanine DNA methyltransferase